MNKDLYDLTHPQKSIFLTEQFYQNTNINNIIGYLKIEKNTNFNALEQALNYFVLNNDSFKIQITFEKNVPKQYFQDFIYEKIEIIDLNNYEQLEEFEKHFSKKCFSLENNYLFHCVMLKFPDTSGILVLSTHHLISDAWTMSLALEQIHEYYNKIINQEEVLATQKPSYLNFIKVNEAYSLSPKFEEDKAYWYNKFNSLPNIISFKNGDFSISSARKIFNFSISFINKIETFCKKHNISIYIFLLSIFGIYFRNIFNTKEFVIGNPVLNRSNFKEKNTAGMFVSVMPFLFNINDTDTFSHFATTISAEQKQMYRHIKYPYYEILNYARKELDFTGNMYDIVFSYQNATIPSYAKWVPNFSQVESLQIHIKNISSENNSLSIHYDYLIDIFSEKDIILMHNRIVSMINQVLENENIHLYEFEITSLEERNDFFKNYNQTKTSYPKTSNIVKEFEKIVKIYPDNIAVSDKKHKLTYRELNNAANILANHILSKNISTEIIAFALKRNIYIYVAILGILKSGHTYMPIDTEYPKDRIDFMLKDSNTGALISTSDFTNNINFDGDIINLENISFDTPTKNLKLPVLPEKLAYIMYTSGSTGVPKAVTIKNKNVLNFVSAMQKRLDYNPQNNISILSVTTVCFDIFVFETFPTLLSGLHLVIADELQAKSPKLLCEIIKENNISKILTTPSRIQLLFEDKKYSSCLKILKEMILGGEPFPELLLTQLKNITSAQLLNLYGPTETTVYSSFKDLTNTSYINIGKPIDNTQIYILNDNNKLLPNKQIGEICIGGAGVGDGYYNQPEKTATAFIKNPYGSDIIYKTGDLGYWDSEQELVCLGRKDHQIKIRGYRIELDDISNNIMTFDGIKQCVVIDKEDKKLKKYLVAYFVSTKDIDISLLKKYLIDILPNYMIPTYFIRLENIPLTLNHKVDRKALPEPSKEDLILEEIILPTTSTEKQLYNTIKQELKISKLGINIDLFDFNLDSLDIIKIQTKLLEKNITLNTQDFYKNRTIQKLADFIDSTENLEDIKYDENYLKNINNSFFKHTKTAKFEVNNFQNILLIGATGFLGIHLLYELLETTSATINCIIRNKKDISVTERLSKLYYFYFHKKLPLNRVQIIDADITKVNIGLSKDKYSYLSKNIDLIINTAANVKYYGNYEDFKKINVDLPDKLSDFCIKHDIKFVHISTLGISGNYLTNLEKKYNNFQEDDFYIGQKYTNNVYIQTKFEAEMLIYNKVSAGLKASIIRVGNLTGRFSDGHFQNNIEDNAFYNILRMMIKYNIIPNTMLEHFLEFTPVDLCAKTIALLMKKINFVGYTFHSFNQNYLSVKNLIEYLLEQNIYVQILKGSEFKWKILNLTKLYPQENILKGIVNDIDDKTGLSFISAVEQRNTYTNFYLDKLGFTWPKIDKDYITRIIDDMKKNKYI